MQDNCAIFTRICFKCGDVVTHKNDKSKSTKSKTVFLSIEIRPDIKWCYSDDCNLILCDKCMQNITCVSCENIVSYCNSHISKSVYCSNINCYKRICTECQFNTRQLTWTCRRCLFDYCKDSCTKDDSIVKKCNVCLEKVCYVCYNAHKDCVRKLDK